MLIFVSPFSHTPVACFPLPFLVAAFHCTILMLMSTINLSLLYLCFSRSFVLFIPPVFRIRHDLFIIQVVSLNRRKALNLYKIRVK